MSLQTEEVDGDADALDHTTQSDHADRDIVLPDFVLDGTLLPGTAIIGRAPVAPAS
jgi:hypothetical protein